MSHVLCTSFADAVSYSGKVGFVSSKGRDIVLYVCVYVCVHWTCGKGEEGNNTSEPLCLTYICVCVYSNVWCMCIVTQYVYCIQCVCVHHIQYVCVCIVHSICIICMTLSMYKCASTHPSLMPQLLLVLGLRCLSSCELLVIASSRSSSLSQTLFSCVCAQ